jgi:hypothetical protein
LPAYREIGVLESSNVITGIGLILVPLCLICIGNPLRLLGLVFIGSAFMAAAVVVIGGYGVSPGLFPTALFVAVFILRTCFGTRYPAERLALHALLPFGLVVAWGLVSSMLMPRLFESEIYVWPQKSMGLAVISPLAPNSGNITQDLYLAAGASLTLCAGCFLTQSGLNLRRLFNAYLVAGLLSTAIAIWQLASHLAGVPFPSAFFLSNPGWAILTGESIGGFIRLTGPCSEPAELASYLSGIAGAAGWILLNGHRSRLAKISFTLASLVILLSTSTTGYAALFIMAGLVANYAILVGSPGLRRRVLLGFVGLCAISTTAIVTIPVLAPGAAHSASIIYNATLNKQQSSSFNDRTSADRDSVRAMEQSFGLGVGWGSDRSSSLIPGLLAGLGAVGVAGLLWFSFRVLNHVRAAHRLNRSDDLRFVMHGCTGGLAGTLVAACVSGPTLSSPDFYLLLALLIATAARVRHSANFAAPVPAVPALHVRRTVESLSSVTRDRYQAWRV